jgi:predicted O-methyltransferase YrrM
MRIGALVRQLWWLMRLPRVASFYLRALARALRTRDRWTIAVVTRPRELSDLVRLARGRRLIVEAGTASGWTAGALALAEPRSRVVTLDPEAHPQRDAYLGLLPEAARRRVELVAAAAEEGPTEGETGVELLFLDGPHERERTRAAFEAWRGALAPGAVVAFHDYGDPDYPGVAAAVEELGLRGEAHGTLFLWRKR